MTTCSSAAAGLLPATCRALTHGIAVGQAEGRTPSLAGAVVRDGGQAWFGARSMLDGHEPDGDTQYRNGWDEALRQEILAPLGMARTTLSPEPPHARGFAVHPWADVMQLEPAEATGLMAPAGELWSTAEDLCRFAAFLLDGDDRVLPATTLAEMRAPASPPGDEAWAGGYGLGLQLFRQDGRMLYGHFGSMPGFLATLCVSPADGVGAITLANATSGPDIAGIAIDLVSIVADHEPRLPDRWTPLPEADQALLALTGLWYWGPRAYALRLRADRGLELGPATGRGRASRFRAEPDGTWTGLDGYYAGETLRLVRGSDGTVDHLDLGSFVFTREPYGQAHHRPPVRTPKAGERSSCAVQIAMPFSGRAVDPRRADGWPSPNP